MFSIVSYRITQMTISPAHAGFFGGMDFSIIVRSDHFTRVATHSELVVSMRNGTSAGGAAEVGVARWINQEDPQEMGRDRDVHLYYRMNMDPAILVEVEERRQGRPLDIEVALVLTGLNRERVQPDDHPGFRFVLTKPDRIEKSKWVEEFLPAFGFHGYQMWELRFPRQLTPSLMDKETRLLGQATQDYNRGEYADAFQDCRKMVESFTSRESELRLNASMGEEQWGRAKHYLSSALHEKTGRDIVRADAEFAISVAAAIHRRVAAALDKPKNG